MEKATQDVVKANKKQPKRMTFGEKDVVEALLSKHGVPAAAAAHAASIRGRAHACAPSCPVLLSLHATTSVASARAGTFGPTLRRPLPRTTYL